MLTLVNFSGRVHGIYIYIYVHELGSYDWDDGRVGDVLLISHSLSRVEQSNFLNVDHAGRSVQR